MSSTLGVFFGSAVGAALVSSIFTFSVAERVLQGKNVIEERAKWRDKIRELTTQAVDTEKSHTLSRNVITQFELRLNPFDDEDAKIISLLKSAKWGLLDGIQVDELRGRVSYLLKHDWERAKWEARHPVWRWTSSMLCFWLGCAGEPQRQIYPRENRQPRRAAA